MIKLHILQPIGLGDIFFCQKIGKYFNDQGYHVIWPVYDGYYEDVNRLIGPIDFVKQSEYEIPLMLRLKPGEFVCRGSDNYLQLDKCKFFGYGIMTSKYRAIGQTWADWSDYFTYKRDLLKERELFFDVLGLGDNNFQLVNTHIGGPGHESHWDIPWIKRDLKTIELQKIDGFTLFDWAHVIEMAKFLHMMETSVSYIMESLSLTAQTYRLFSRSSLRSLNYWEFHGIYRKPDIYLPSNFVRRQG